MLSYIPNKPIYTHTHAPKQGRKSEKENQNVENVTNVV